MRVHLAFRGRDMADEGDIKQRRELLQNTARASEPPKDSTFDYQVQPPPAPGKRLLPSSFYLRLTVWRISLAASVAPSV